MRNAAILRLGQILENAPSTALTQLSPAVLRDTDLSSPSMLITLPFRLTTCGSAAAGLAVGAAGYVGHLRFGSTTLYSKTPEVTYSSSHVLPSGTIRNEFLLGSGSYLTLPLNSPGLSSF